MTWERQTDWHVCQNLAQITEEDIPNAIRHETGVPNYLTVIISLILPNVSSLIPLTFMTSSILANGRVSMIA